MFSVRMELNDILSRPALSQEPLWKPPTKDEVKDLLRSGQYSERMRKPGGGKGFPTLRKKYINFDCYRDNSGFFFLGGGNHDRMRMSGGNME